MKNLFIIILLSVSVLACAQRENTLPLKSTTAATDTFRVVKDNQSALMLRSVFQAPLYDSLAAHTDTLQALRDDIDAGGSSLLLDSINVHRTELNNLHDSITVHRTEIDANLDSIAVHRTALDNAVDSIADHRTEINANTSTGANNGTNISSNSVFIGVNTADIASLEDSITKHTDTLQVHQGQIAALQGGGVSSDSSWTSITVDTIYGNAASDAQIVFDNFMTSDIRLETENGAAYGTLTVSPSTGPFYRNSDGTKYSDIIISNDEILFKIVTSSSTPTIRKAIIMNNSEFTIDDSEDSTGLKYDDDYSANFTDRSLPDVAYVRDESERVMHVVESQILYSNTTQTTIVTLPANTVIWDIQLEVRTGFTGTGTDLLDIGVTGDGDRYLNDESLATTGFKSLTLTNNPDRMSASTAITFTYTDENSDAAAGEAYVYIHYSLH